MDFNELDLIISDQSRGRNVGDDKINFLFSFLLVVFGF